MFFDSHAHLNFEDFPDDYSQVIERCQKNKVKLISVGANYETSCQAVEMAEKFPQDVWASIGMHPNYAGDKNFDYQKYLTLAKSSKKVVAIGETGLDYKENPSTEIKIKQKELFQKQIKLAQELNKPLIIH